MERKIKQALCLSWQETSELISNQLHIALGQEIPCKARLMDEVYWAVFTSGHVFTMDELIALLTYADAKPDVCAEVFSIEGNTTKSLPAELGTLPLRKALHLNWELEYPTEDGLWLLDITMEI